MNFTPTAAPTAVVPATPVAATPSTDLPHPAEPRLFLSSGFLITVVSVAVCAMVIGVLICVVLFSRTAVSGRGEDIVANPPSEAPQSSSLSPSSSSDDGNASTNSTDAKSKEAAVKVDQWSKSPRETETEQAIAKSKELGATQPLPPGYGETPNLLQPPGNSNNGRNPVANSSSREVLTGRLGDATNGGYDSSNQPPKPDEGNWTFLESPDGKFVIWFPAAPAFTTKQVQGRALVSMSSYSATIVDSKTHQVETYSVEWIDMPREDVAGRSEVGDLTNDASR